MRKCPDCRIILDDDVQYCPNCGKSLSFEMNTGASNMGVSALLASANLHRSRKEWDKALADASEAFKLEPGNSETASMLGLIYEERGMLDEAAVWYKMALDLNPSSTADRARLQRVLDRMAGGMRAGRKSGQPRANTWVWAIPAMAAVLVAIILLFLIGASKKDSDIKSAQNQSPVAEGTKVDEISSQNPFSRFPDNKASGQGNAASSSLSGVSNKNIQLRTPAESEIGNALRKSGALQALGVKVDDVIADPRHSVVTVTFSMPVGANLTRESIIRGAAAIVKTAFDSHSAVNNVTARCVISSDMGTQIAFIGDASRSSIQGLPDNPTIEQMEQIFNNPWWNPNIR